MLLKYTVRRHQIHFDARYCWPIHHLRMFIAEEPGGEANSMTLNPLHADLKAQVVHYGTKGFATSDKVMNCCISTAISLVWSEEHINEKG